MQPLVVKTFHRCPLLTGTATLSLGIPGHSSTGGVQSVIGTLFGPPLQIPAFSTLGLLDAEETGKDASHWDKR